MLKKYKATKKQRLNFYVKVLVSFNLHFAVSYSRYHECTFEHHFGEFFLLKNKKED